MPTINIQGQRVRVGDEFLSLSPEQQNATVDEIASSLGLLRSPAFNQTMGELSAMTRDPRQAGYDAEVERRAKTLAGSGMIASGAGGLARGATLGTVDRIAAGLAAIPNAAITAAQGGSFDPMQEYRIARDASLRAGEMQRERDPVSAIGGELVGSAVSGVGLARAVPAVFGAGTGGVLSQAGRGAAQGAAMGAVYGGAQAQEGDVTSGAMSGAAVGAGLGAALPVVGRVAKTGFDIADSAVSPYLRPEAFAAKKVAQRLASDNQTVQTVQNRLARMPGGTVADVAGENTRGLVRTSVNVPGAGRQTIQTRANVRQMGANDRVTQELSAALGDPATFNQVADDIVARQQEIASPLYTRAFQAKPAVNVQPVLDQIDKTIAPGLSRMASPQAGIGMDSVSAQLAFVRSKLANARNRKIDLELLHLLKQDIDGAIGPALRQGNNTLAAKLVQVQKALLEQMDAASPDYKQARAVFAGEAKLKDALETGRSFILGSGNASPRQIPAMTPAEKQMARLGAARALKDAIDSAVDGADLARRLIGTKAKRDALKVLIENSADRNAFMKAMIREARFSRTRNAIVGNSTTARQQADMEDAGIGVEAIGSAARGNWFDAIRALVLRSGARIGGVTPEVSRNIANLTMTRDPRALQSILDQIARNEQRSTRMGTLYRQGLSAGLGATAPLSGPGPTGQ